MGGHARECWPQLLIVELRKMEEKPKRIANLLRGVIVAASFSGMQDVSDGWARRRALPGPERLNL
jgi:hypothetical protein